MGTNVMFRAVMWIAKWLLPADERGESLLGDLEELYSAELLQSGRFGAVSLIAREVLSSVPGFVIAGVIDRGVVSILARSIPAVVVGYIVSIVPLIAGGQMLGSIVSAMVGVLFLALFSWAGGWVAAACAGAAPRQHALLIGLLSFVTTAALPFSGAIHISFEQWVLGQSIVFAAAVAGGTRYVRSRQRSRPAA
jgi:hypothetical protein